MTIEINEETLQKMIDSKINGIIDNAIGDAARKYVNIVVDQMMDREHRYSFDTMRQYIRDAVEKAVNEKIEAEAIFTPEYMSMIVERISKDISDKVSSNIKESVGYYLCSSKYENEEEEEY